MASADGQSLGLLGRHQLEELQRFNKQEGMATIRAYRETPLSVLLDKQKAAGSHDEPSNLHPLMSERMRKRMQKMMHYEVSLLPFNVTIQVPPVEMAGNENIAQDDDSSMQSLESNSEDLKDVSSAAHATTTTVAGAVAATRTADVEPDGESSNGASSNGAQGIESKRRCEIEHEIKKGCHQQASSESFSLSPCSPMLQGIQDKAILPSFYADDTHKLGEQHIRQYSSGTINAIGPMEAKLPGTLLYLSGADEAGGGGSSGENTVGGVGGIASVPESHFLHCAGDSMGNGSASISNLPKSNISHDGSTSTQQHHHSSSLSMCTPMSFPPSPNFRASVLAYGHTITEDVVYSARDQLRRAQQLTASDLAVREVAAYLATREALAIFNSADSDRSIMLTRGGHCAAKRQTALAGEEGQQSMLPIDQLEPGAIGACHDASARAMVPVLHNRYVYFQFSILDENDAGTSATPLGPAKGVEAATDAITVGLSTQQLPLDSPIGSKYRSIGLRSDGRLLFEGLSYDFENPNTKAGASFGVGSTIGILVYRDDSSVEVKNNIPTGSASVWLSFTINGSPIVSKGGLASSPAIFLSIPHNEELFPTITITTISVPSAHEVSLSGSRKTSNFNATETRKILGRFCAADIVNPSRHFIRAPMECTVYGLDGSLVLAPHESRATMPLTPPPLSSQPPSTPQQQIQRTKPVL